MEATKYGIRIGITAFYYADYEGVTTRRISYAPSMGVTKILDEVEPEIKKEVFQSLMQSPLEKKMRFHY